MYRFLDVATALGALRGREARACPLWVTLTVCDPFLEANAGTHVLTFADGRLAACEPAALADQAAANGPALAIDVAEFSSLLVGAVRLRALHNYGLATLSDPSSLGALDAFFACEPARCTTGF
jgi:hypothetical protein